MFEKDVRIISYVRKLKTLIFGHSVMYMSERVRFRTGQRLKSIGAEWGRGHQLDLALSFRCVVAVAEVHG